jgi:hypothetical protein
MIHIIILDMKRIFVNLFRQVEINLSQQRTIQTSINRLQSVEEVFVYFDK